MSATLVSTDVETSMTADEMTWLRYKLQPLDALAALPEAERRRLWLNYEVLYANELGAVDVILREKARTVLAEHRSLAEGPERSRFGATICGLLELRQVLTAARRLADDLDSPLADESDYLISAITAAARLLHVADDGMATIDDVRRASRYLAAARRRLHVIASTCTDRKLARKVRLDLLAWASTTSLAPVDAPPIDQRPPADQIADAPAHANAPPAAASVLIPQEAAA